MNQLKGKLINVVLFIQESRGIDSVKNLLLVSNFNGRVLESDLVNVKECPYFHSNFVWELEKKDLRKIRSFNKPLRVDCINIDAQNHREKFGYVLLDIRSAQVITDSNQQIVFKWHKLFGVRNKKRNSTPELYLSLTVRNQTDIEEEIHFEDFWQPEPRKESSVPITYMEDGHIIIGEQSICQDEYSMNIIIKSANNLDLLLPEVLVFNQNNNKYYMCVKIFGIPITTKLFSKDLHDQIVFEEKIVIKLRSNKDSLDNFFKEETFEVEFNCGNDVLGKTILNFDAFLNLDEKIYLPNCFFSFPSPNGIMPTGNNGRKPFISLDFFLEKHDRLLKSDVTDLITNLDQNSSVKESGDYEKDSSLNNIEPFMAEEVESLIKWQEIRKIEFEDELKILKEQFINEEQNQICLKKLELDENIQKCKELQEQLQEQLDEISLSKTLQKKKKSSNDLLSAIENNKIKFADCDNNLLIEYITNLQSDNEHLKQLINKQKHEFETMQKTDLTKEQTMRLLQELKVLEEKFELAQQDKRYFKQQWKTTCQEIHLLKTEDYKQMKNQICEQREELHQIDELCNPTQLNTFLMQ